MPMPIIHLPNPISFTNFTFDNVTNYKISSIKLNLKQELLLLSCTLYRLCMDPNTKGNFCSISLQNDHDQIIPHISGIDHELTEKVRKHYSQKFLVHILKGTNPPDPYNPYNGIQPPLTKFRRELNEFLNKDYKIGVDRYEYNDDIIGMIYKLPYFYSYDCKLTDVVFGPDYNPKDLIGDDHVIKTMKSLKYIDRLSTYQRSDKTNYEYWFVENGNENRVMVKLQKTNPILSLWEKELASGKLIDIQSGFHRKHKDQFAYYDTYVDWKLV